MGNLLKHSGTENRLDRAYSRNQAKTTQDDTSIPLKMFKKEHLPAEYRKQLIVDNVKCAAKLTGYIQVSADRPKTRNRTETQYPHSDVVDKEPIRGYGFVCEVDDKFFTAEDDKSCPCQRCKDSGAPTSTWGRFTVVTAAHVVWDDEEARKSVLKLPCRSRRPNVVSAYGSEVVSKDVDQDWCEVQYVTHEPKVHNELRETWLQYIELRDKVYNTYKENNMDLAVIITCPNGVSRNIQIGRYTEMKQLGEPREKKYTSYMHTAYCSTDSNGAPVLMPGIGVLPGVMGGWRPSQSSYKFKEITMSSKGDIPTHQCQSTSMERDEEEFRHSVHYHDRDQPTVTSCQFAKYHEKKQILEDATSCDTDHQPDRTLKNSHGADRTSHQTQTQTQQPDQTIIFSIKDQRETLRHPLKQTLPFADNCQYMIIKHPSNYIIPYCDSDDFKLIHLSRISVGNDSTPNLRQANNTVPYIDCGQLRIMNHQTMHDRMVDVPHEAPGLLDRANDTTNPHQNNQQIEDQSRTNQQVNHQTQKSHCDEVDGVQNDQSNPESPSSDRDEGTASPRLVNHTPSLPDTCQSNDYTGHQETSLGIASTPTTQQPPNEDGEQESHATGRDQTRIRPYQVNQTSQKTNKVTANYHLSQLAEACQPKNKTNPKESYNGIASTPPIPQTQQPQNEHEVPACGMSRTRTTQHHKANDTVEETAMIDTQQANISHQAFGSSEETSLPGTNEATANHHRAHPASSEPSLPNRRETSTRHDQLKRTLNARQNQVKQTPQKAPLSDTERNQASARSHTFKSSRHLSDRQQVTVSQQMENPTASLSNTSPGQHDRYREQLLSVEVPEDFYRSPAYLAVRNIYGATSREKQMLLEMTVKMLRAKHNRDPAMEEMGDILFDYDTNEYSILASYAEYCQSNNARHTTPHTDSNEIASTSSTQQLQNGSGEPVLDVSERDHTSTAHHTLNGPPYVLSDRHAATGSHEVALSASTNNEQEEQRFAEQPGADEEDNSSQQQGEFHSPGDNMKRTQQLTELQVLKLENEYLCKKLTCVGCHARPINVVFLPCGHFAMCDGCSMSHNICPMCNKTVLAETKTYLC